MSGYTFPTTSMAEPFNNPYNPDYLSKVWRARHLGQGLPVSSSLTEAERNLLYISTFNISGSAMFVVSGSSNLARENVTMTFTGIEDAPTYTTNTNASGQYNQSVLTYWSGSVTPSSASAVFTPTTIEVSKVIANQTLVAFSSSL